jgi:hypothetical protein
MAGNGLLRGGHEDDPGTLEPHYLQDFLVKTR